MKGFTVKRLRLLPFLAAVVVVIITAFTGSSAVASIPAPNQQFPFGLPAGKFLLLGAVERPQILTVADLEKLPQQTIEVTFRSGSGQQTHTYTGPLLFDVLTNAGPRFDPAIKNDKLRYFISFNATDSYRATVAWGEIDPGFENKKVLLATTEDGRSLATEGPRLVVPGDISGGRYVSNVVRMFFQKPPL